MIHMSRHVAPKLLTAFAGIVAIVATTGDARPLHAQQQQVAAPRSFEVTSISEHEGPVSEIGLTISGPRVTVAAYTVNDLVADGYNLKDYQVAGATGWMNSDRYDIAASAAGEGAPTRDQARQMLQTVLAERFQLKSHTETKEMPVYALVIGKNGQKLKENAAGPTLTTVSSKGRNVQMTFSSAPLERLIWELPGIPGVDRPVLDKTGLTGSYDFQLNLTGPESDVTAVFTALQEQLGLKLEPQKVPIGILVIDRAEKPTEK